MKPFDYLHLQMELEGIKRLSRDLIGRTREDDDFPLVLVARLSNGDSLVCFDEGLSEEIRSSLSKDDLQAGRMESALQVFKKHGISANASHFKTYIFPESIRLANPEAVKCFNSDDPKIIAFGFNGLADKVFAIEKEDRIVSACVSSRQNSTTAEAWVFTHSDYRRKGLAQQVVTVWATTMQKEGLIPFYSHNVENSNSARLAKRLNLIEVFEEFVIETVV